MPPGLPPVSELNPLQVPLGGGGEAFPPDLSPGRMVSSNPESLYSQPHQPESEQVRIRWACFCCTCSHVGVCTS